MVNKSASSVESVGKLRLRQLAKCMIQCDFRNPKGAESVGFSQGEFGFIVEALHDSGGELFSGPEIVQNDLDAACQEEL